MNLKTVMKKRESKTSSGAEKVKGKEEERERGT